MCVRGGTEVRPRLGKGASSGARNKGGVNRLGRGTPATGS